MNRFGVLLLCALSGPAASAAAENLIEPGQWKITSNNVVNGAAMPPQVKARCLTPEQAGDVANTLRPATNPVHGTCERTEEQTARRTRKCRPQGKGHMDM